MEKYLFILTDDVEVVEAKLMTDEEHEQANYRAERYTGSEFYWLQIALPEGMTAPIA